MPIESQDVLKINIVLVGVALLAEQEQRDSFTNAVGTEMDLETIVSGPLLPLPGIGGPAGGETGWSMRLRRDSIRIDSLPSRTTIEKEYPDFDNLVHLADVTGRAISLTDLEGQALTAFGFNVESVYRSAGDEPSAAYLAKRLFPNQQRAIDGCVMTRGAGQLTFEGGGAKWTITMGPRANDPSGRRVFLGFNLHRDSEQVPDQQEILGSLEQVWKHSLGFAAQLDAEA